MADKVTLANIASFQNDTTAAAAYNSNNALIITAMDNTLSRDGTSPNQMGSNLDMNSNQILNLPSPGTVNSPARLIDVTSNPTITVPPVGTSGATVPLLNAANTWSGVQTYSAVPVFPSQTVTGSEIVNSTITNTQLATNTVINSNLSQMPSNTLKGNNTGSTANALDLTTAQVLTMLNPSLIVNVKQQVFTSSGTYTPSLGLVASHITVVGGGAGGGGTPPTGATQCAAGGGGGAGGFAFGLFTAAQIGASKTVTIGAGGSGGTNAAGSNGGTTSVGALIQATGGTGGPNGVVQGSSTIAGGASGGVGSGGYFNAQGGPGGDGWGFTGTTGLSHGGEGGTGLWGTGTTTAMATASSTVPGIGAPIVGAGGSGSAVGASQSQTTGGAGLSGIVIIIEYTNQ